MASKKGSPYKLTKQQTAFVEHYSRHLDALAAYHHAYPKSKKWTRAQAASEAHRVLANPNVAAVLSARAAKVAEIAEKEFAIDARSVLQRLAAIAFAEPADYYAWGKRKVTRRAKDGTEYEIEVDFVDLTPSDKLNTIQKRAIVSVEMTTNKFGDTFQTLKLADPVKALVKLGEHLQLFNGKLDVNVNHQGAVKVEGKDVKASVDPKDALKLFDAFRKQQLQSVPVPSIAATPVPPGRPN